MTIRIARTDSSNIDFINLVKLLDQDLAVRDGDDHDFYDQYNKIDHIKHVVVAYADSTPVACGAIKPYSAENVEVKRMYTIEAERGKGIAGRVLNELENWARELDYKGCILETGIKMPEAIGLYLKSGYDLTPNYGQYKGVETSRCFRKNL